MGHPSFERERNALRLENFNSLYDRDHRPLGLGYPLLVTGIAGALFHDKAAGSLVYKDGRKDVRSSVPNCWHRASRRTSISIRAHRPPAMAMTPLHRAAPTLAHRTKRSSTASRAPSISSPRRTQASLFDRPGHHFWIGLDPDITPDAVLPGPSCCQGSGIAEDRIRQLIEQHKTGASLLSWRTARQRARPQSRSRQIE